MKLGLLGGSFNPIHRGHLAIARAARAALGLDRVVLVPSARPPHKRGDTSLAPAEDRLAMARLAAASEPGLEVSAIELERAGPSYTIDTVRAFLATHPGVELSFIVGADSVPELRTWKDARALLALARFAVVARPGYDLSRDLEGLARDLGEDAARGLRERVIPLEPDPVSATEVRARVRRGEPIDGLVPDAVRDYLRARGLYQEGDSSATPSDTNREPTMTEAATIATVRTLDRHDGKRVELRGWAYKTRAKGKLVFLHVRDGSGIVQLVGTKGKMPDDQFEAAGHVVRESAVVVRGLVRADARAPGGFELDLEHFEVVSPAKGEYPIALQEEQGTDHLLSIRHLWLREKQQHAIMRVRNEVEKAIRDFYYERDFVLIDAPIFTPNACEGTTTLFEVKYFEDMAYLTQSGQLYMEAAAMAHGKVYCFGPVFRAEKSKTRRHLTEFWMVEPEIAYGTLDDVMTLAEEFVSYVVQRALERCKRELKELGRDTSVLEKCLPPFPRISYDDAVEHLKKKGHPFEWGGDLGSPDETEISKAFDRPVMIHRYPAAVKAFYMRQDPQSPKHALCVDVIAPEGIGEIIGGGERAIDLAFLEHKIEEEKLPKKFFEWYLDLRRYGSVPHAGFGLGLERTVQWITGREHVRETIPFPRMMYRKEP